MADVRQVAIEEILARLSHVLRSAARPVPLHEPEFGGNEWAYLRRCLDDREVSSIGAFVTRFEADLARVAGAQYAIATVNGTAALHVALMLVGVQPGDEVLLPALSFVAAADAACYCGATPHLIDVDVETLGPDVPKLRAHLSRIVAPRHGGCVNRETSRRIAALVVLHAFGHPADLDEVEELCAHFGLPLVEDGAQALGSSCRGRPACTVGRAGILSFNGNKILTTGGGGALLTNDSSLAHAAKHLTTTGRVPHPWAVAHDRVAYNYRLPNINAALGCAQLEQLPDRLQRKRRLAEQYQAAFADLPGVTIVREPAYARSNYWLNLLALEGDVPGVRDALLSATHDAGILTRPAWDPMHRLAPFVDCPRMDLSGTDRLFARLVALPSSPALADGGAPAAATPAR